MTNQRILIIEDEDDIRDLIEIFLKKEGYQIEKASLGSEGLALLQEKKIDLILLDWMLPDQSGIEVIHFIKKFSKFKRNVLQSCYDDQNQQ